MTSQLTSHSFSRITRSHRFRSSFAAIMASCLALAGLSDVPASAQEGDFGAAAAGDPVTIEQVVLNDNGTYLAQNSAATSVLDSGDDPVEIVGLTINQNGAVEVLGDINLGPVTIQNLNIPTDESNYAVSENGQVTPRNSAQFSSALARNLVSPDLRDFQLAGDGNVSWGSDWDAMYGSPFSNDDYLVVAERHGNSSFELGALGEDGSLIAGSNRLVVPANYSWNTGFAPSDSSDQAMHISVYDIEAFGVDTAATQIFGFRYFSTGVADIKIWGASAEPFTEACPPGAPVNDIAAAQTGRWTRVNASTYRAPFGDTFVTATFGGSFEAQLAVMDQMDANDYSVSTVKNSDALDVVHNFPNNATVAFTFDDPVVDPSIHFARIGGYSGWGRVVWSHSSVVQLGGGLEWSETASNGPHFETTSTDLRRTIGALLDEHRRTGNMGAWNFGMAGGSTEITGTVTQIPLTFSAAGQAFDAGTGDSIEVVLTKPAVEGCGGVTDVDAVKSANAAVVVLEGEVEWSLHTTSTGTSEAENMVVIDSIPDALDAKSIRTGRWTPDGIRAKFSARVNGSWLTVANATGRTDATFSLPAGTDQVKVEYRDNLPTDFATTSPVTIVTDVISAASLSVQNCATWSADEMASKPRCQLIEVQELKAIPNLTAWNESQAAGPGEDISFKLRVENLNSAARPYVAPFLGVLLPDGLEFSTWAPISSGAAPAMTVVTNHNGTGRSLVRFDFGGTNIDPGDLYELRMITTVTGSAGAGVSEISFGTATNDNTHEIECAGTTAADIFDLDVDGVFAEELCSATATYEVEANFEVITAAHSKGNIGLPFINYDGEAGVEEVVVELEDIATGINTQTVGLPQIDTGLAADGSALGVGEDDPYWTRSDTRVSARTAARAVGKCNLSFPDEPAMAIWTDNGCDNDDHRWFQRAFTLDSFENPGALVLRADAAFDGEFTFYVNNVEQNQTGSGHDNLIRLTGPFVAGQNLIEIDADGQSDDHGLAIDFEWERLAAAGDAGVTQIDLNESATHTQSSTGNWGWLATADLAGDGNNNGQYWNGSVSHTASGSGGWWQADLHAVAAIDSITIWNRTDCCQTRIRGAALFLSPDPFNSNTEAGMRAQPGVVEIDLDDDELTSGSSTVAANGVDARYVRIIVGNYLHLAEVDIVGHVNDATGSSEIDNDWMVSDTLDGPRRPAILATGAECDTPWSNQPGNSEPIWADSCAIENESFYFHREIDIDGADDPASLIAVMQYTADNTVSDVYVNGVAQGVSGNDWQTVYEADLDGPFVEGVNTITIHAGNSSGPAGLLASVGWKRLAEGCPDSDGFTTRPCIAQAESHDTAVMRFDIDNTGNVAAGGVVVYGTLPYFGDTTLISGEDRNSDFALTLVGEARIVSQPGSASVSVQYSMSTNPCRPELGMQAPGVAWPSGCDMDWTSVPEDISDVTAVRVVADIPDGSAWEASEGLRVELDVRTAQGSFNRDEYAWMSWGSQLQSVAGLPLDAVETVPAGLMIPRSVNGIGDWIWLDQNRDGIQDPDEVGVNGVEIELYDVNRELVATTVSQNLDNNSGMPGYYWFGDLVPGQYYIHLTRVPISWNTMSPDLSADDTDSDISPLTRESPLVTVEETGLIRTVDVGFFIPQGPATCVDDRPEYDPTDTDQERREVAEASPCPG